MRDWAVATLLGALLTGVVFALPVMAALFSVLLTPALFLLAAIIGIWFLLQILKESNDSKNNPGNRRGPDP